MNGFGVSPLEIMASDAMLRGIVYLDQFDYSASWIVGTGTALGAAPASVQAQIQINGDSDFIVQEMNLTAFDNGAPPAVVVNPNLLLTVTRSGAGRELMNAPQHVLNVCGSYVGTRYPAKLPCPGLLNKSNNLTLSLQNLSTTVFSRVDVVFRGFKVFYVQSPEGVIGNRQMVFHAL